MNIYANTQDKVSKITENINTDENKELLKEAFDETMIGNGVVALILATATTVTGKTFAPSKMYVPITALQVGLLFWAKKADRKALKDIEL